MGEIDTLILPLHDPYLIPFAKALGAVVVKPLVPLQYTDAISKNEQHPSSENTYGNEEARGRVLGHSEWRRSGSELVGEMEEWKGSLAVFEDVNAGIARRMMRDRYGNGKYVYLILVLPVFSSLITVHAVKSKG